MTLPFSLTQIIEEEEDPIIVERVTEDGGILIHLTPEENTFVICSINFAQSSLLGKPNNEAGLDILRRQKSGNQLINRLKLLTQEAKRLEKATP